MSAFLCSDKHFAVVAKHLFVTEDAQQFFADHLKRENIKSVNYRYAHHGKPMRFRKVNLFAATPDDVQTYTIHDILRLLECVEYQSCEHPDRNEVPSVLAERLLKSLGADAELARPGLWSI